MPENFVVGGCRHSLTPDEARELEKRLHTYLSRIEREKYGHKDISFSDFGWWHCRACGRSGDDYTDPEKVKCEPEPHDPDEEPPIEPEEWEEWKRTGDPEHFTVAAFLEWRRRRNA